MLVWFSWKKTKNTRLSLEIQDKEEKLDLKALVIIMKIYL